MLQADGDFPVDYRKALGTRIYGCDDCQIVCPPSRIATAPLVGDEVTSFDLIELLTMSDEDLIAAVGLWYIPKRDFRYVRRNALVALGNSVVEPALRTEVRELLEKYTGGDEMLDRHARWAADELGVSLA